MWAISKRRSVSDEVSSTLIEMANFMWLWLGFRVKKRDLSVDSDSRAMRDVQEFSTIQIVDKFVLRLIASMSKTCVRRGQHPQGAQIRCCVCKGKKTQLPNSGNPSSVKVKWIMTIYMSAFNAPKNAVQTPMSKSCLGTSTPELSRNGSFLYPYQIPVQENSSSYMFEMS